VIGIRKTFKTKTRRAAQLTHCKAAALSTFLFESESWTFKARGEIRVEFST
jgi:hypothetical protein